MPYLANTYFVKPEQSNPSRGVFPPQTYFTPRYDAAVRSTRAASADGGGDSGMRLRAGERGLGLGTGVGPRVGLVLPVSGGMTAGSTAMMVERTSSGDTPRLAEDAHPASDTSDATAIAPARGIGGVIMPAREAGSAPSRGGDANACANDRWVFANSRSPHGVVQHRRHMHEQLEDNSTAD